MLETINNREREILGHKDQWCFILQIMVTVVLRYDNVIRILITRLIIFNRFGEHL